MANMEWAGIQLSVLALTGLITFVPFCVEAAPKTARAFCAKNPEYAPPIEAPFSSVPPEVIRAGGNAWRCMGGKVMACYLGASGSACLKTMKVDAERMATFRKFCRDNPDDNFIPMSLIRNLASTWRCDYKTPVQTTTTPVDKAGYYIGSWWEVR
jgi:hypothetical protein